MTKKEILKTVIVDDNPEDIQILKQCLAHYTHIDVVCTCNDGKGGLEAIMIHDPDLLFLDIELPDMSGIEFLESLDEKVFEKCRIVAYTSYVDYMLRSFRNHAFDFLQKPVNRENLNTIIRRLETSWSPTKKATIGTIAKAERHLMTYINQMDFLLIKLKDIGLFEYDNKQRVWMMNVAGISKPIKLKRSVYNKDIISLSNDFVQVHQSYIVNIDYLMKVVDNVCYFYPPFNLIKDVKVGKTFRKNLINIVIELS
ncbi:MAG: response regulator [Prevotella sp.]|nr:response regulator [Prevotella sp.]MBQ6210233.1 response regulator [Prevotella sp.]